MYGLQIGRGFLVPLLVRVVHSRFQWDSSAVRQVGESGDRKRRSKAALRAYSGTADDRDPQSVPFEKRWQADKPASHSPWWLALLPSVFVSIRREG